jgi:hypothetical protein
MRRILLSCLALLGVIAGFARVEAAGPGASPPVDFHHLPWKDGETLTYLVSMGIFDAAEGTFTAHDKGSHWEFDLKLASRGLVDQFYPFTGNFWCLLDSPPTWRSVEYGEYRFEPKRTIKEQTKIDYEARHGTREIWIEGKTNKFPVAEDSLDDVGTMLYHLRTGHWKVGDRRLLHVYESDSEKEGLAECDARETRSFGSWPKQPMLHLTVLPGKGTHHRGSLSLWMTDDARHLPLHADLEFRYGTFTIDLEKASGTR